jgi:hypothetical protein
LLFNFKSSIKKNVDGIKINKRKYGIIVGKEEKMGSKYNN